jgi:hypothetical protein
MNREINSIFAQNKIIQYVVDDWRASEGEV